MTKFDNVTVSNPQNITGEAFTAVNGVSNTSRKAILMGGSSCIKLFKFSLDAPIARTCFETPESCKRGISASIWVKFHTTDIYLEEVFFSSGEKNQGMFFRLDNGYLKVTIRGRTKMWHAALELFKTKDDTKTWTLLGFTWDKWTNRIILKKNEKDKAFTNTMSTIQTAPSPSEYLHMGCQHSTSGKVKATTYLKATVLDPTVWFWPVVNTRLLMGDAVLDMIKVEQVTVPPLPTTQPPIVIDYSESLDPFPNKGDSSENPLFAVADMYYKLRLSEITKPNQLETATLRGRSGVKLSNGFSDGVVQSNVANNCPCNFTLCRAGLSLSVWVQLPKPTVNGLILVLGSQDSVSIGIHNNQYNFFVNNRSYLAGTVTPGKTVNLAFMAKDTEVDIYINGKKTSKDPTGPPAKTDVIKTEEFSILVGLSRTINASSTGVGLSDLVIWKRRLFPFEVHRFLGYTREQFVMMFAGDMYWTADPWVNADMVTMSDNLGTNYKVNSIYQLKGHTSTLTEKDRWMKSDSPVLNKNPKDFYVLGNSVKPTPDQASMSLKGNCFTDTDECRAPENAGLTASIWLKIRSVSDSRERIYLNTGSVSDESINSKGISIYTKKSLLQISVTNEQVYTIRTDSNSYKLGEWINLGLAWSPLRNHPMAGSKLFLNGNDFNIMSLKGTPYQNKADFTPHAMIGCLDDVKVFTTSADGQSLWEMADMTFGDVVFFKRVMDIDEFRRVTGLEDANSHYRNALMRWQGTGLIDLKYTSLKFAKDKSLPIGPFGTISWTTEIRAAKLMNGHLILNNFQNQCPGDISLCPNGISVGGWFRAEQVLTSDHTFVFFTTGNQSDNKDNFGMELKNKQLTAWVKTGGKSWTVQVATVPILYQEWQHFCMVWSKTDGLKVYINANFQNKAMNSIDYTDEAAVGTDIHVLKIGHLESSGTPLPMQVFNFVVFNETLGEQQLNKLLGLKTSHVKLLKSADIFFTFSGMYKSLKTPKPIMHNVKSTRDKSDDVNSAFCTNNGLSYINMGDVGHTCLIDPTNCTQYMLTINLKLEDGAAVILSSGSHTAGGMGLTLIKLMNNSLEFTLRESANTYSIISPSVTKEWFQLQFFYKRNQGLRVKSNGENVATIMKTVRVSEVNTRPANTNFTFGTYSDLTDMPSRNASVCVSDIVAKFFAEDVNVDEIANSMLEVSCYKEKDYLFPLKGNVTDHRNKVLASSLSSHNAEVGDFRTKCLSDPSQCHTGLTVSIWVKISAGASGYIFSTGPPNDRGVAIKVIASGDSYDVNALVMDGASSWTAQAGGVLPIDTWTNIALTFSAEKELVLFSSGKASARGDSPAEKIIASDTSGLLVIGRDSLSSSFTLDGAVVDLVVWLSVRANCEFPDDAKINLEGICNPPISTNSTPGQCNLQPNCTRSLGELCLDASYENVISMSRMSKRISASSEAAKVLKEVLNKVPATNEDLTSAKAAVLTNILDNWDVPPNFEDNAEGEVVLTDILTCMDDLHDASAKKHWKTLQENGKGNAIVMMNAAEGMFRRISKNLKTSCIVNTWSGKTVASQAKKVDINSCPSGTQVFSSNYESDKSQVKLPWKLITRSAGASNQKVAISALFYKNAHEFLSSKATNETSIDSRTNTTVTYIVNSRILTLSIFPKIVGDFAEEERVSFQLSLLTHNFYSKKPVGSKKGVISQLCSLSFWDNTRTEDTIDKLGQFNSVGCRVDAQTLTEINGSCSHQTSFAALMQPIPEDQNAIHRTVLSILTYVGIGISLVCLLLFFFVILFRKELAGERYIIHMNLCVAMFTAQLCFVLIDAVKGNEMGCRALGVCMHFFFVAAFAWIFVEAQFSFYAVTAGITEGRLKCYFPFAWGAPILVVGVTAGMNINAYGGKNCWLIPDNFYIWAFLGPILIFIFLTILTCFIVACNIKTPALKKAKVIDQLKSHSKQTACVMPLMLLAWLFGVLLIISYSLPIEYIFVIFNAPQGLWVFLCFGLGNPEVKAVLCRRKRNTVADSQQWENVNTRKTGGGLTFHSTSPPQTARSTRSLVSSSGSDVSIESRVRHTEGSSRLASAMSGISRHDDRSHLGDNEEPMSGDAADYNP